MIKSWAVISISVVLLTATSALAGSLGSDLAPHRAIYKMSLASTRAGASGVTAATGAMSYKFGDSCDGWITETKTALSFSYSDGAPVATTWDLVTWESKDGLHYRFRVRSTRDGTLSEDIEGVADLEGKGKGGLARFTLPEASELKLPKGTLFPTEHTLRLIEVAQHGGHLLERSFFDGTGTDQIFSVNAVIGKSEPVLKAAAVPGINGALLSGPSWPMHLAFFPGDSSEADPDYEVGVRYYQNGVADDVLQSFGSFSLRGTLEKLETQPRPDC
jgi:hypothetical protein